MTDSKGTPGANGPIRILYVDDNPHDRDLVRDSLENCNRHCSLVEASSHDEFLRYLEKDDYDLVLSDFNILGFEGLDILHAVKKRAPSTPVVIITGTGSEETAVDALKQGAEDYVVKTPHVIKHLPVTVDAVIEKTRLQQAHRLAEEDLLNTKAQLEEIVAKNIDGMLVTDHEGDVVFANAAAATVLDREPERMVGTPLGVPIISGSTAEIEIVHQGAPTTCVELRATDVEWGGREATLVALRDVTKRKRSAEQVLHLNHILRAIRKINQLIVREHDCGRLLEQSCDALTATREYNAVWLAVGDGSGPVEAYAQSGWGSGFDEFARRLERGQWPKCADRALDAANCLVVDDPTTRCADCPLSGTFGSNTEVVTPLQHAKVNYGFLGVSFPSGMDVDGQERDLLSEVAGDLAFALQDIKIARARQQAEKELKRYEKELKKESFRAQRYLDVAAVILLGLDTEGKITLLNRRGCEVLGFDDEKSALGQDWFQFIPKAEREEVETIFRIIMCGGVESHRRVEAQVQTLAGESKKVVWHNAIVTGEDGKIIGTLSSGEDVTQRRAMEAQLAQADRLSSMGMLAAGVAHEINNPLAYILYNLESLAEDLPELLQAVRAIQTQARECAWDRGMQSQLESVAQQMNPAMLDDILARFKDALGGTLRIRDIARGLGTFSKVEKDQLVPVKLMHIIDAALSMAFNEIKYRARLVRDFGKVPRVMASEGRLSQVFLNLIINATHAIDEGNVEDNEIRVRTWAEGDSVFAEVRDTGSGIAPENLSKLFEPFFTTKKIGVGSGLGLAISKNIIESYGGTIDVESELGTGTSFIIRLPVKTQETTSSEDVAARQDADAGRAPSGRVLIVDDEDGIRAAMVRMLRKHDTVQAASGAEAKELLETDQGFDLILCDMMMSDISGMELHQWLAEEHPFLAKQFIFITGGAFTPRARDYLKKIDNIRLEKPFDVANFKKIVSEFIQSGKNKKPG